MGKLKEYKIELETLDLNLKYFGFRWWHILFTKNRVLKNRIDKFDLIIDLQTKFRNSLIFEKNSSPFSTQEPLMVFFFKKN